TVACDLVKWGKWARSMVVHSVTRGWQDIRILLGVMGAIQPPIPCPTEGCLVISVMRSSRHFSKTYPRKGGPVGPCAASTSRRPHDGVVSPSIRCVVSGLRQRARHAAPRSLRATAHVPCGAPVPAATSSAEAAPGRAPHGAYA